MKEPAQKILISFMGYILSREAATYEKTYRAKVASNYLPFRYRMLKKKCRRAYDAIAYGQKVCERFNRLVDPFNQAR